MSYFGSYDCANYITSCVQRVRLQQAPHRARHFVNWCGSDTLVHNAIIVLTWRHSDDVKWRSAFRQESRAVARKPRDAAAVLFGLKFADNIHNMFVMAKVVDFGTNRKRVCDFLHFWSSIVTLACPVSESEILQVSWEERPHPYSTRIFGVFPLD